MGKNEDKHTRQVKSKINKDLKINPHLNHKINMEIDSFTAGPETEYGNV